MDTRHGGPSAAARLIALNDRAARRIEAACGGWLVGLAARGVFAATLLGYFWASARTKIGEGPLGLLQPSDGAYIQILPTVMEAHGYDSAAIAFLPWGLIVLAGTLAEIILPALLVLGLFTRGAALGMAVFIAVQSWVDIAFHHVDAAAIGAPFDRIPDAAIADQRLLWLFVLIPLLVHGAGAISLDALLRRRLARGPAAAQGSAA